MSVNPTPTMLHRPDAGEGFAVQLADFLKAQAARDRHYGAALTLIGESMQQLSERQTRIEQKCDLILRGKLAQDAHVDELTNEVLNLRGKLRAWKGGAL